MEVETCFSMILILVLVFPDLSSSTKVEERFGNETYFLLMEFGMLSDALLLIIIWSLGIHEDEVF